MNKEEEVFSVLNRLKPNDLITQVRDPQEFLREIEQRDKIIWLDDPFPINLYGWKFVATNYGESTIINMPTVPENRWDECRLCFMVVVKMLNETGRLHKAIVPFATYALSDGGYPKTPINTKQLEEALRGERALELDLYKKPSA